MKKIIILISFLFIFLCSCNKLNKGIVIRKWYEVPSTHVVCVPMLAGKTCTVMPIIEYDAEKWCISVSGKTDKGKIVVNTYCTSKQYYKTIKIGQLINTKEL